MKYILHGILVPVRTSFGLRRRGGTMYQREVDVDASSEQGLRAGRSASPHQP